MPFNNVKNDHTVNKKVRLAYLDGIRGVAALLVVFGHFKKAFFNFDTNSQISTGFWGLFDLFFLSSEYCVYIFFVLSGFVLGYNSFTKPSFLRKQWTKRFFRLFAPVLVSALIYFVVAKSGGLFFSGLVCHLYK